MRARQPANVSATYGALVPSAPCRRASSCQASRSAATGSSARERGAAAGSGGDSCAIQFQQEKAITFHFMQIVAGGQRVPCAVAERSVAPDHLGAELARASQ